MGRIKVVARTGRQPRIHHGTERDLQALAEIGTVYFQPGRDQQCET